MIEEHKQIGIISLQGFSFKVCLDGWRRSGEDQGSINPLAGIIYLASNQSPDQMLITLVHEVMHYLIDELRIAELLDTCKDKKSFEEEIAERLDGGLTSILLLDKDNQALFSKILSQDFD